MLFAPLHAGNPHLSTLVHQEFSFHEDENDFLLRILSTERSALWTQVSRHVSNTPSLEVLLRHGEARDLSIIYSRFEP